MQQFTYTIKDDLGIHARPAGLLVRLSSKYNSQITLVKDKKTADAKKIFSVMSLGVRYNDTVTVTVQGSDETEAADAVKGFFETSL
jgi:phosphocarrier protein